MTQKGIFPTADNAFNTYINTAMPYLNTNRGRLGVNADNLTEGTALLTQWNDLFPQSQDRNTRTTSITIDKNKLRKAIEGLLRSIYADIPRSTLTTQDRTTLNLRERDAQLTKIAVAVKAPGMEQGSIIHLQHSLRFINPIEKESRRIPEGQRILLETYVGAQNMEANTIPFANGITVSKAIKKIAFTDAQVGKTAYYRACYINNSDEKGPWSEIFEVVVA